MPLYMTRVSSLKLSPQELIRRFHAPPCGSHPWLEKDPVRKLTGDVEELLEAANKSCAEVNAHAHYSDLHAESKRKLVSQDVQKNLHTILEMIDELAACRDGANQSHLDSPAVLRQLVDADLPAQLLAQLPNLEFEARKDVMNVCSLLLRRDIIPEQIHEQVVDYLSLHPRLVLTLVEGCTKRDAALHCGVVLRSCARHQKLATALLDSGKVYDLLSLARHPSVDIAFDAFETLRDVLLKHKEEAAVWLDDNFERFFHTYNDLLRCGEYITERQAQKLLVDMFLHPEKRFQKVMMAYVGSENNLEINMNFMRNRSKAMQTEAFHVFKLFVTNPNKPRRVQQILFKNKTKLAALLTRLRTELGEGDRLNAELGNVLGKLSCIDAPAPARPQRTNEAGSAGSNEAKVKHFTVNL